MRQRTGKSAPAKTEKSISLTQKRTVSFEVYFQTVKLCFYFPVTRNDLLIQQLHGAYQALVIHRKIALRRSRSKALLALRPIIVSVTTLL